MANSGQLCQQLENISREALQKYERIVRNFVRGRHGVYALYRRSKLYYVGLASNLRSRLRTHLKDRHGQAWDRFSVYLTIGDRHIKELESLILRIVKPTGNKQSGRFVKCEDLRRKFKRHIRSHQKEELKSLILGPLTLGPINGERDERRKVRGPVLASYIEKPMQLRARHKGRRLRASVRRDGLIRFAGNIYRSPSGAGAAAIGGACDGWFLWKYERAPGDWVLLDDLRKRKARR